VPGSSHLSALALAGLLAASAAAACGVEEYRFVPDEGGGAGAGSSNCETGLDDCDHDSDNGCETDLASDSQNCGRCGAVCASDFCSGGICTSTECPAGSADCNQDESDRCEANLSSLEDCVVCGKVCSDRNGEASCTSRGCAISCGDGFGDCDEDADTGCEADFAEDIDHCGACGAACVNEHGRTSCSEGRCRPSCTLGFDDCNEDPADGCEADLGTSRSHCGACGERCRPENATGSCVEGVCEASCDDGFADCNGDITDGCEADLSSPETCGDCATHCSDNGGTPLCDDGECDIRCDTGRGNCINGALDGCETNTNLSVLHCSECGHACPTAVGTPACLDGICGVSNCTEPFAECDREDATACETDVTEDPDNCGGCGIECFFPHASGNCVNRSCVFDECEAGWGNCANGTADGCETQLGTTQHCAACGNACTNQHGTTACAGAPGSFACSPTCAGGWVSCTNPDDGCELDANLGGVVAVSGNARVTLSWSPVAAATSYVVRRSTTSAGPYTNVATGVTTTSYVNTGLTNGTLYYFVVAAVVPCATGPNSAEVASRPDGGLVAHYLFDETSGTAAADSSGNGRTATLSGASWTAGRLGNAVRIAGGSQRVNLPANIVQGCTDLTIATFVRLTTSSIDWGRIFDFGGGVNNYLFVTARGGGNALRFAITNGGLGNEQAISYGYAFPTATWKHVAVVLAGNTGRLYLDGVEVAQNTGMTLNPADLGGTPNDWLGDSQYAADPTLDGALDDFRISCRAYSAQEIAALAR
jgi:hypothetical protein